MTPYQRRKREKWFLDQVPDSSYRAALQSLFEACELADLEIGGELISGLSFRCMTPKFQHRTTVVFLFPPEARTTFRHLRDLNLGYTEAELPADPASCRVLRAYRAAAGRLRQSWPLPYRWFNGVHLSPQTVVEQHDAITQALIGLSDQLWSLEREDSGR